MARRSWMLPTLLAAGAFALGACSKHADDNASARVSPGTGNGVAMVQPSAPDGPPGGPNGVAGSLPHPGSSGGDVMPGTSGKGTADASGRSATPAPGVGLNGGLGAGAASIASTSPTTNSTTSAPSGTGPDSAMAGGSGSTNSSPRSAVGTR